METISVENVISNGHPKDCSTPKTTIPIERQERITLQVLQESAKANISHGGGRKDLETKKVNKSKVKIVYDRKTASSSQCVKIFEDSSTTEESQHVRCSRHVQTEDVLLENFLQNKQLLNVSTDSGHLSGCFDQEAYDLLVNESVPESYWKELAEQRRQALNDTLEENEKLSTEVEHLKKENRRLSDIASKVEYLENILQEALSDDGESDDQSKTKPEVKGVSPLPKNNDCRPDKLVEVAEDSVGDECNNTN